MKKHVAVTLFVLLIMMLGGCYSAIPEMTEQEEDRVTQYMAELILEYDTNYQSSYLKADEKAQALAKEEALRKKAEEIRKEEEKIRQEKEEANTPDDIEISSETGNVEGDIASLNEYLGFDSLQIDYAGSTLCMRYPESEDVVSFAMTPSDGNEFIVLKFKINNTSDSEVFADTLDNGNYFVLRINESVQKRALTTLLEKDLSIYSNSLQSGMQDEVVLVFEKPLDLEPNSLVLEVRSLSRDIYKKIPLE